jgi:hypothetical protein
LDDRVQGIHNQRGDLFRRRVGFSFIEWFLDNMARFETARLVKQRELFRCNKRTLPQHGSLLQLVRGKRLASDGILCPKIPRFN